MNDVKTSYPYRVEMNAEDAYWITEEYSGAILMDEDGTEYDCVVRLTEQQYQEMKELPNDYDGTIGKIWSDFPGESMFIRTAYEVQYDER